MVNRALMITRSIHLPQPTDLLPPSPPSPPPSLILIFLLAFLFDHILIFPHLPSRLPPRSLLLLRFIALKKDLFLKRFIYEKRVPPPPPPPSANVSIRLLTCMLKTHRL